jgi:hypothetical protein
MEIVAHVLIAAGYCLLVASCLSKAAGCGLQRNIAGSPGEAPSGAPLGAGACGLSGTTSSNKQRTARYHFATQLPNMERYSS